MLNCKENRCSMCWLQMILHSTCVDHIFASQGWWSTSLLYNSCNGTKWTVNPWLVKMRRSWKDKYIEIWSKTDWKLQGIIVSLQTQLIDKNDDNDAEWCFTQLLMQLVLNYNTHNNNLHGTHQHCRSSINLFKEHIYAYNNNDLKLDHMNWLHVIS